MQERQRRARWLYGFGSVMFVVGLCLAIYSYVTLQTAAAPQYRLELLAIGAAVLAFGATVVAMRAEAIHSRQALKSPQTRMAVEGDTPPGGGPVPNWRITVGQLYEAEGFIRDLWIFQQGGLLCFRYKGRLVTLVTKKPAIMGKFLHFADGGIEPVRDDVLIEVVPGPFD